jgi:anti-sigma B factor antagonist
MASVNDEPKAGISVAGDESGSGRLTVSLSGELDIVSVDAIEPALDDILARPASGVDLDLTELAFMDSSGLAVLVRLANTFGPLRVIGARPLIRRVIEVTGLHEILRLEDEAP